MTREQRPMMQSDESSLAGSLTRDLPLARSAHLARKAGATRMAVITPSDDREFLIRDVARGGSSKV